MVRDWSHRALVLGVSLEHTTLDFSGVPDPSIGDEVVVVGRKGEGRITLAELAERPQVHPLEALTAFSRRMPIAPLLSRPSNSRPHHP
jgi:alanine racemase